MQRAHRRPFRLLLALIAVAAATGCASERADSVSRTEAPLISEEIRVRPPVYRPDSRTLAAAYDGTNYVALWERGDQLVANRIDANGASLDEFGQVLTETLGTDAAMVFDGSQYTVFWITNAFPRSIRALTMTPALETVAGSEREIYVDASRRGIEALRAIRGTGETLLLWQARGDDRRDFVSGRILRDDSTSSDLPIWARSSLGGVAFDGERFLAATCNGAASYARLFDRQGQQIINTLLSSPISGSPCSTEVTFDGSTYLLSWVSSGGEAKALQVTPRGIILDTDPATLFTDATTNIASVFDGEHHVVVGQTGSGEAVAVRVSPSREISEPLALPELGVPSHLFADATGYRLFVTGRAWRLDEQLTPMPPATLFAWAVDWQQEPALWRIGERLLLQWKNDQLRYETAWLSLSGTPLQDEPLTVPSELEVLEARSGYVAFWRAAEGPRYARLANDGTAGDATPILSVANTYLARGACSDSVCLFPHYPDGGDVYVDRLILGEEALRERIRITTSSAQEEAATVVRAGDHFLVFWRNGWDGDGIYVARVTADGQLQDALGKKVSSLSGFRLRAVAAGDNHVVLWTNDERGILGAVVAADGTVIVTDIAVANPDGYAQFAAASDSDSVLVAWRHPLAAGASELRASRITADGALVAAQPIVLADQHTYYDEPTLAMAGPGRWLIAYAAWGGEDTYLTTRVRGKLISLDGTGIECTSAIECESGFCVDGVCCNSACGGGASDCQACSAEAGAAVNGICGPVAAGATCRDSAGQCDAAEACDGTSLECPADVANDDGTVCDDGNACTQTDSCQAGACTGGDAIVCEAMGQCFDAGVCDPATGTCSSPAKDDGLACDDGNSCTQIDSCQRGECLGSDPVVCEASDQCHQAGECEPSTGVCSDPEVADGTACSDGQGCEEGDMCNGGECIGGDPAMCEQEMPEPEQPADDCTDPAGCDDEQQPPMPQSPRPPNSSGCQSSAGGSPWTALLSLLGLVFVLRRSALRAAKAST